jgi:protocatechuate 3,4-dioxygenase beta subunit
MKKTIVLTALTAIAIQVTFAGTITGVVTDDLTGLPVQEIWIDISDYATGQSCDGYATNSEGIYSISNLAAGTYRVKATAWDDSYIAEFYDNTLDYEDAMPVTVTSSGVTQNINFGLAIRGGIIRGTVIDPNGQPVTGMRVNACNYTTYECYTDITDSQGDYSIRCLLTGTYWIAVEPDLGSMYVRQYYDGQDNWENATLVVVDTDGTVEENIDFQLTPGGGISGTVTDPNGQPITNRWVTAIKYNENYSYSAWTDDAGMYQMGSLSPGLYRVMIWADDTIYASKFYDNTPAWDWATPVSVSVGQWTTGIDFALDLGASISGVIKDPFGAGQANVQVFCGTNGDGSIIRADSNGYYKCSGLAVGYTYNVIAYPQAESNYAITRIAVDVNQPGEYIDRDIVFDEGGLILSGRITDKATALPLADVRVGCWRDDLQLWTETRTEPNGIYRFTSQPPGEVNVQVQPDSYYAYMGIEELQLEADINDLDFALPAGAMLCGKVMDNQTAQPLGGVVMEYSSDSYSVWQNAVTDLDGTFCLTQLPPGIAELKAEPSAAGGYAWNLPWGSNWICLDEGESRSGRLVAVKKGALVSGYMKDAYGNPLANFEYSYEGRDCNGWGNTDINGFYQVRLPVGTYYITVGDNEEFGTLPEIVTVTDVNGNVSVPDIIVYTAADGGHISGQVNNPGNYAMTGNFVIVVFKAGTILNDPKMWYTIQPVVITGMEDAGPFSLDTLPPDANYDVYLCVGNGISDIDSLAIRDSALNVAVGTTDVVLDYTSQGSAVGGSVKNTDDNPVLGATVILWGSSGFSGFCQTNCNGEYLIQNVSAGIYTMTATHSKYLFASTLLEVLDGVPADTGDIVMAFSGDKEGPDLNGDGNVDIGDLAEFAAQWLHSGTSEADFNQDNEVNLDDWSPITENWLTKAIWYHE